MKFGICRGLDQSLEDYPHLADYVEISAMSLVDIDPKIYADFKKAVEEGSISTYSCNGLFPADIRLTGDVDWSVIKNYCDETFYKLAELNIKMLVFGSGKAKHVPDGFDRAKAWDQLYELGARLSDTAKQYGQTVVVEPLRYAEVNIVNTVAEGGDYCRTVNRDNFKLLVDFYHFVNNKEDPETLMQNRDLLAHTHIATVEERTRPTTEAHWSFFEDCLKQLKAIAYKGNLSFEGGFHAGEDMSAMVARMKEIQSRI
ncbi:MAG: sugar phosphate isomerase/epimerase [Clostridia bacterium]|nr:sugar phosphate isomerase/epimerase [Clostridia bacterium]